MRLPACLALVRVMLLAVDIICELFDRCYRACCRRGNFDCCCSFAIASADSHTMSSPITPDVAISNLHSTALSARCHNVFFRQKQLKSLHDVLRNNASDIRDALKQDTRASDAEVTIELALALETVKEHYNAIHSKRELESEYLITNGKDAQDRSEPWGVTFIEPQQSHTPLFSTVAVLSAALRAGNCIALKVRSILSIYMRNPMLI